MSGWLPKLLEFMGLTADAPHDTRIDELDQRSRKAIGKAAEKFNDRDLRRLAALDTVRSVYDRDRDGS